MLVLNCPWKGLDSLVMVKLGLMVTQVKFPLKYILPETTTEREGAVSASDAQPIQVKALCQLGYTGCGHTS